MNIAPYLPEKFESFKDTKFDRRTIKKAHRNLPLPIKKGISFPNRCRKGERCLSGFCPTCMRNFRRQFLRFAHHEQLANLNWLSVTILIDDWTIPAGVYDNFGELKDHLFIKQILQRFRRLEKPGLLMFGSIETVYKTLDEQPIGKPFHLHMMISGVSKKAIHECLNIPQLLSKTAARPVLVKRIKPTLWDFIRAASYSIKQPFWQHRKYSASKRESRRLPTLLALGELLSNYGHHNIGDRSFYIGIRFQHGQFRFTENMKSVITNKLARKTRAKAKTLPKNTKSHE